MPASLPPPPPPRSPADVARAKELALVYALAPLVVGLLSRLGPLPTDVVERALATGAIYLEIPCLFCVLVLVLTQTTWAGWITFSLEAFLLGMLPLCDALALHTVTARGAASMAAIGYTLMRQLAWGRSRVPTPTLRAVP